MDPIEINECYRKGLLKSPSIIRDSEEIEKSELKKMIDYFKDIPKQIKERIDYVTLMITKKVNYRL